MAVRAFRELRVEMHLVKEAKRRGLECPKGSALGVGYPDRLVIGPNGKTVWFELKAPLGKLRDAQEWRIKTLRFLGYTVYVPRTNAEVDEAMEKEFGSCG